MTSPELIPDDLPQAPRHAWVAVAIVLSLCVALYVLDVYLTGWIKDQNFPAAHRLHTEIVKAVLENFIAGAIAALLLALTYRWVIQLITSGDRVLEISPSQITERLLKNAKLTRNYVFIGNTATFVTASVLPILVDSASSKNGSNRTIALYILDPTDPSSVSSYVVFKDRVDRSISKVSDSHLAQWIKPNLGEPSETHIDVKAKILAAIYLAAYASLHQGITMTVFLRKSFTPFRADISDAEVVLTQESASEAAVAFSKDGHFYRWYQKDAEAQQDQSQKLDFTSRRSLLRGLMLAHPRDSKIDIELSLVRLLENIDHLTHLKAFPQVLQATTARISRPTHGYKQ
ncbi:hypothetical protein D9M73_78600 [compost metagenome]